MKFFSFLFLFVLSAHVSAQYEELKYYKQQLKDQPDREKIETYLNISEIGLPVDSNLYYLDLAMRTAEKIKFDSVYAINFAISINYYMVGDYNMAKDVIRGSLRKIRFTTDTRARIGHVGMLLGAYCEANNELDSALYYYDHVINYLEKDTTWRGLDILGSTYQNKANIHLKAGEYEKAISIYFESLLMAEIDQKNASNRIFGFNNIASCYQEMKQYEEAIYYYEKAISLAKARNKVVDEASVSLGLGETYRLMGDEDRSLEIFEKSIDILETAGFVENLNIAYRNLAEIYLSKGNVELAKLYSDKALLGIQSIPEYYILADVYLTRSRINKRQNQYSNALNNINEAYTIGKNENYLRVQKEAIEEYIDIYGMIRNFEQKALWYDTLVIIHDSILNTEHIIAIAEARSKYETEKEKRKNAELELNIETKNRKNAQLYLVVFISLSLLAVVIYILISFYIRLKKERLRYDSQLKTLNQELAHAEKRYGDGYKTKLKVFHQTLIDTYKLTDGEMDVWYFQTQGLEEDDMAPQLQLKKSGVSERRSKLYRKIKIAEGFQTKAKMTKADSIQIYCSKHTLFFN